PQTQTPEAALSPDALGKAVVFFGSIDKIKSLLDSPLLPEMINYCCRSFCSETPLINDCELYRIDIIPLLLEKGADPEAKDRHGNTALYNAAAKGNFEVVTLLLKGVEKDGKTIKAEIDAKNGPNQLTALHIAVQNKHEKVVKLLLQNGADYKAKDFNLHTP